MLSDKNESTTNATTFRIGVWIAPPYTYECALLLKSLHDFEDSDCPYPGIVMELLAHIMSVSRTNYQARTSHSRQVVQLLVCTALQLDHTYARQSFGTLMELVKNGTLDTFSMYLGYSAQRLRDYSMSRPVANLPYRLVQRTYECAPAVGSGHSSSVKGSLVIDILYHRNR